MSDNVVRLNTVPPRQTREVYKGYEIVYSFNIESKRWMWAFDHVTRIPFSGENSDIEKAKRDAHKHIDDITD